MILFMTHILISLDVGRNIFCNNLVLMIIAFIWDEFTGVHLLRRENILYLIIAQYFTASHNKTKTLFYTISGCIHRDDPFECAPVKFICLFIITCPTIHNMLWLLNRTLMMMILFMFFVFGNAKKICFIIMDLCWNVVKKLQQVLNRT